MSISITATTLETAAVTFFGGLLGYLSTAGFALSSAALDHGVIVGAVAALAALGYHALSGNVTKTA